MAILDNLPTKGWSRGEWDEIRDDFFAEYAFAKMIQEQVLLLCNIQRVIMSWQLEFNWMCSRLKGKSLITVILKLTWNVLFMLFGKKGIEGSLGNRYPVRRWLIEVLKIWSASVLSLKHLGISGIFFLFWIGTGLCCFDCFYSIGCFFGWI